jgi:hypothetical protein
MTQAKQTVRLQANIENLVGNLKYAFSNPDSVLSELMQNARRAQASKVEFQLVEDTLIVSDDGIGIADMQSLFSIAESSWGEDIKAEERPYGMGWLSCLYNATSVLVESRGKRIEFNVTNALGFQTIDVQEAKDHTREGTRLELRGFAMPECQIRNALRKKACGFAIEVAFNGEGMARPHAEKDVVSASTPVGRISVKGIHFGEQNDLPERVILKAYLQGLPIYHSFGGIYEPNVIVHLDSTRFLGVMPDRAHLHDEVKSIEMVDSVVTTLIREHIAALKGTMPATVWIRKFWSVLISINAQDLTFDVPYIPAAVHQIISDPSPKICMWDSGGAKTANEQELEKYWEDDRLVDGCITRESLESGMVQLASVPLEDEETAFQAAYVMAFENRMLIMGHRDLPKGHWGNDFVLSLNPDSYEIEENAHYKVTPVNLKAEGYFSGDWTSGKVVIADSFDVVFEVNGKTVASCHTGVSFALKKDGSFDGGEIVFCVGDTYYKHLPHQVRGFTDGNDGYLDHEAEDEMGLFERYVKSLIIDDPAVVLGNALENSSWELRQTQALRNRSFNLSFDSEGQLKITLLDAPATSE